MALLDRGDRFPSLNLSLPGGETLTLPDALRGGYGIVLFYRGSWCPYCKAQLRAFQAAGEQLAELGARVVATSADDEATTRDTIRQDGLRFPVAYGAQPAVLRAATGAFINEDPPHLQSTGFVLDRSGRIVVSVYSSGAIGRLVPADVLGLIRHRRNHASA
jgi:peroxiredoxin